jgi:predicted metal-dependent hydrolase
MTEKSTTTLINGKPARYRVRRSAKARRLTLHVDKRDGLVVVLPRRMPLKEVGKMLAENAAWIDKQLDKHGVRYGPVRREYANGSKILVLGKPRRLVLHTWDDPRKPSQARLDADVMTVYLSAQDIFDVKSVLERWLRRTARQIITDRVAVLAARIGLQPGKLYIGERTTRWGSCSGSGNLSFCYRLVMAPLPVVDAVIAHELCHLRHLNHSRRFYRLLKLACPDYQVQMDWLHANEEDLQL